MNVRRLVSEPAMFLAQANIALFRWPLDDPRMMEFVEQIPLVNRIAESSDGFIWRFDDAYLPQDTGPPWNDPLLFFNMSVWRDEQSLRAFLRSAEHQAIMRRRANWVEPVSGQASATWWIAEDTRPTIADAIVGLSGRRPVPNSEVLRFVSQREHTVWRSVINRDGTALSQSFTDNYIEVTLSGKRVVKNQVVDESPQTDEISAYSMDSEEVIALADGAVLLNYHVTIDGKSRGEQIRPKHRWATSIWRRDNGCWKCCFFQQSPYPFSDTERN